MQPASVPDRTAVLETARRGSTPRRAAKRFTSSGCAGLACNPAKVEVQVRFLARTLVTLEPDGTAAACKAAFEWVRLPPASLPKQRLSLFPGQRRARPRFSRVGWACSGHGFKPGMHRSWLAQLDRAPDFNLEVAGSTPVPLPQGNLPVAPR